MKNRKAFIISIALHAAFILTVYVFQSMIFPYVRIFGLVPLLLPIVSAGIAVYQGCHVGGIVGFFAGILCDVSFNDPVGVFTVFLTVTGLVIGAMADSVIRRGFVTYLLSCIAILILSAFVQMFPFLVREGFSQPILFTIAIRQTIYSLFFVFPLWVFIRNLSVRAQEASARERPL
jgi:rod shape-determining protein MreD